MKTKSKQDRSTTSSRATTTSKSRAAIRPQKALSGAVQPLVVRGTVLYPDKSPAIGLSVVALDKDIEGEDRLGEVVTDAKGGYWIDYSDARFHRSQNEKLGADVFVRVYRADGDLQTQSRIVRNAPADLQLDVQLPIEKLVVRGQVRFADGSPVNGASVRAYDKDVRLEQPLGEPVITGTDGRYKIVYTAREFSRAEKASADVRVTAYEKSDKPVSSDILFNASPDAVIDLVLPWRSQVPSEFELLVSALLCLLKGQAAKGRDLPIDELEPIDVDFLAKDTGIERQRIEWLVEASKLAKEPGPPAAPPAPRAPRRPQGGAATAATLGEWDPLRGILRLVPPRPAYRRGEVVGNAGGYPGRDAECCHCSEHRFGCHARAAGSHQRARRTDQARPRCCGAGAGHYDQSWQSARHAEGSAEARAATSARCRAGRPAP